MVRLYGEFGAPEIALQFLNGPHNTSTSFFRRAVCHITRTLFSAQIEHGMFVTVIIPLAENSTSSSITRITLDREFSIKIGSSQYQTANQYSLQA